MLNVIILLYTLNNTITGTPVGLNAMVLLLGVTDNLPAATHTKLFIFYCAYYVRKIILINWKKPDPPGISAWRELVNTAFPLYKLTYMDRNCPNKFHKIWSRWVEARHLMV